MPTFEERIQIVRRIAEIAVADAEERKRKFQIVARIVVNEGVTQAAAPVAPANPPALPANPDPRPPMPGDIAQRKLGMTGIITAAQADIHQKYGELLRKVVQRPNDPELNQIKALLENIQLYLGYVLQDVQALP